MTSVLTENQIGAIRDLRDAWPEASIALIGGAALGLHLSMAWRTTMDMDFIVTIPVADIEAVLTTRQGWKKEGRNEHRWRAPNGQLIDIVPAPPEALAIRKIVWPRTGNTMSLEGVRLALNEPAREIAPDLFLSIASIPVIVMLKMAAYLDNPSDRRKDLQDIAHILDQYPLPGDDRFFEDDIYARAMDERRARGFILGREMGSLLNEDERRIVETFVTKFWGDDPATFVAVWPRKWVEDEELIAVFDAFREGFRSAIRG